MSLNLQKSNHYQKGQPISIHGQELQTRNSRTPFLISLYGNVWTLNPDRSAWPNKSSATSPRAPLSTFLAAFDLGTTLDDPPDDDEGGGGGGGGAVDGRGRRPSRAKRRYRRLGTRPNSSTTASVRSLGESAVMYMLTIFARFWDCLRFSP